MRFEVKLNKSVESIIKDSGINCGTLTFAAEEARRFMNEYVPMNSGALCESAEILTVENENKGTIFYNTPYAIYCYYGENRNFSSEKHQKACAFWDKAMMQVSGGELIQNIRDYIKKGG